MMDAPWYVDIALAASMTLAALAQYLWLAKNGHSAGRWLQAIGWTGLSARVIWALVVDGNVPINAVSVPFLVALAGGTVLTAWRRIVDIEREVYCLQKPEMRCYREDRIKFVRKGVE